MTASVTLALFLVQVVTPIHGVYEGIVDYRFQPTYDIEKGAQGVPAAILMKRLEFVVEGYSMKCYYIPDGTYTVVMMKGGHVIHAAKVTCCDKDPLAKSIRVVPDEHPREHSGSVQYTLTDGRCERADYINIGGDLRIDLTTCVSAPLFIGYFFLGYSYGWKVVEDTEYNPKSKEK